MRMTFLDSGKVVGKDDADLCAVSFRMVEEARQCGRVQSPTSKTARMFEALSFFSSAFSLAYLRVGLQHCWWDRSAVYCQ